jgi:Tfp pilus assembly protein PilO
MDNLAGWNIAFIGLVALLVVVAVVVLTVWGRFLLRHDKRTSSATSREIPRE